MGEAGSSPALSRSRGSRRHVAASRNARQVRAAPPHPSRITGRSPSDRVSPAFGHHVRERSRKAPMSTPTTARGALLRRAGTLLVAAVLIGAPASAALADPTAGPTAEASPTASVSATTDARRRPSPSRRAPRPRRPTRRLRARRPRPRRRPRPARPRRPAPPPRRRPARRPRPASSRARRGRRPDRRPVGHERPDPAAAFIARTLADGGDHYVYPRRRLPRRRQHASTPSSR